MEGQNKKATNLEAQVEEAVGLIRETRRLSRQLRQVALIMGVDDAEQLAMVSLPKAIAAAFQSHEGEHARQLERLEQIAQQIVTLEADADDLQSQLTSHITEASAQIQALQSGQTKLEGTVAEISTAAMDGFDSLANLQSRVEMLKADAENAITQIYDILEPLQKQVSELDTVGGQALRMLEALQNEVAELKANVEQELGAVSVLSIEVETDQGVYRLPVMARGAVERVEQSYAYGYGDDGELALWGEWDIDTLQDEGTSETVGQEETAGAESTGEEACGE